MEGIIKKSLFFLFYVIVFQGVWGFVVVLVKIFVELLLRGCGMLLPLHPLTTERGGTKER